MAIATGVTSARSRRPSFSTVPLALTIGARYDRYSLLVQEHQLQPRLGVAWALPGNRGVARASYNRNFQTPPLENLLLSSSPEAAALAPDSVRDALGNTFQPIRSERQDVVEVGYQRGLGRIGSLDVSAYWKGSRDQQDNNNFFDTGIIFPTTLAAIDVRGAEARLVIPERHGVSGTLSVTTSRAISTPPFTGGLFLGQDAIDLLTAGPFAIDHDQRLSMHATAQWRAESGWWMGGSARYDSGLVANPSDPNEVALDPDFADLLPYVDLRRDRPPRATPHDCRSGQRRRPAAPGPPHLDTAAAGDEPDQSHGALQLPVGVRRHPSRPAENGGGSRASLLLNVAPSAVWPTPAAVSRLPAVSAVPLPSAALPSRHGYG